MADAPYSYEYINSVSGTTTPAFVKIRDTQIARFFKRYLMQDALSIFDWTLPDNWDPDYFRYILMGWGYIAVFKTDKFGVIPNQCTLSGYNVFYRPTRAIVANPLIRTRDMELNTDCTLIKLSPDYRGIADIVDTYGNMMALAYETAAVNIINSKLSFVFGAETKAEADTLKSMYDSISQGEPAVFARLKKAGTMDTKNNWATFSQNVGQNYIAPDVMDTIRQIRDNFLTEIGIPNLSTRKKERVNLDESEKNTAETHCKALLWLEEMQRGIDQTVKLFPEISGSLSVKLRFDEEVFSNDSPSFDSGAL